MRARPPQSATSRHYAEPIQANSGDYDELDGDYDLAGRDSTDRNEGYVHRVRPRPASLGSRRTSDMSISVQGPPAPQRTPAPPYAVSRDKPRRAASPLAEFAADPLAAMRHDDDVDLDAEYDAVDDFQDDDGYAGSPRRSRFSELGDEAPQPATHGPNARAAFRTARQVADDEEPFPSARAALQRRQDDQPPTPRSGGSVEKKVSWAEDEEETQAERDATTVFHAELDVDFRVAVRPHPRAHEPPGTAHEHGLRGPPRALRDRRLLGRSCPPTRQAPDVGRQDTVEVLPPLTRSTTTIS